MAGNIGVMSFIGLYILMAAFLILALVNWGMLTEGYKFVAAIVAGAAGAVSVARAGRDWVGPMLIIIIFAICAGSFWVVVVKGGVL